MKKSSITKPFDGSCPACHAQYNTVTKWDGSDHPRGPKSGDHMVCPQCGTLLKLWAGKLRILTDGEILKMMFMQPDQYYEMMTIATRVKKRIKKN